MDAPGLPFAETITTANSFIVSANATGERVMILNGPRRPLEREEVYNLAAWLIAVGRLDRNVLDRVVERIEAE